MRMPTRHHSQIQVGVVPDRAEVAYTLSWITPPGVRVIPYAPTNSLLIVGNPAAVERFLIVLGRKAKTAEGQ